MTGGEFFNGKVLALFLCRPDTNVTTVTMEERDLFNDLKERLKSFLEYQVTNFRWASINSHLFHDETNLGRTVSNHQIIAFFLKIRIPFRTSWRSIESYFEPSRTRFVQRCYFSHCTRWYSNFYWQMSSECCLHKLYSSFGSSENRR